MGTWDYNKYNMTTWCSLIRCDSDRPCPNVIPVPYDCKDFMVQCGLCQQYTNILKGLKSLQVSNKYPRIRAPVRIAWNISGDRGVERVCVDWTTYIKGKCLVGFCATIDYGVLHSISELIRYLLVIVRCWVFIHNSQILTNKALRKHFVKPVSFDDNLVLAETHEEKNFWKFYMGSKY